MTIKYFFLKFNFVLYDYYTSQFFFEKESLSFSILQFYKNRYKNKAPCIKFHKKKYQHLNSDQNI